MQTSSLERPSGARIGFAAVALMLIAVLLATVFSVVLPVAQALMRRRRRRSSAPASARSPVTWEGEYRVEKG